MTLKSLLLVGILAVLPGPVAAQGVATMHRDACELGDLLSCNILGLIWETGAAGRKDRDRAARLYERACDRGVTAGCTRLQLILEGSSDDAPVDGFVRVGRVADAETGAPVAEAIVDVPRLGIRVVSDEAGLVDLGRLRGGEYDLVARRSGYETARGELPVPWESEFLILMYRTALTDELSLGRIFGQVLVDGGEKGLGDVEITVLGETPVGTVSNRQGRFSLAGLEPGPVEVRFRRLGYTPRTVDVVVTPGRTVEIYAPMSEEPIELEPIEVTIGSGYLERSGFYRRARSARGERFTRRDVELLDPVVVSDLLWRAPSVSVQNVAGRAQVFSRRPSVGGSCRLQPYLDGVPMVDWDLDLVRPDDLAALEVYQGVGTPVEYRQPVDPGGTLACGVVLIWTRRNN